jgi:hypothetical protein
VSANETNYELLQIREALANLPSLLSSAISTTSGAFQVYMAAGWSPVLGLADDGTYYYIQVKDWVGGTGTKPLVGQYLSTSGWTNNIASASRIAIVGGGIPDGDKGDIVVSSGGTVWTIEARAVTAAKLFEVGAHKFLGNHSGSAGDVQEIGLGGGLEFHGGSVRRAALTGDVTASAGSNSTTITPAADPSWITSLALNKLTQSGATTNQVAQWNGTAWVPVTFSGGIGGTTGATDNALLRADGTGGATVQTSTVTIDDSGNASHTNWTVGSGTYSTRTYARIGAVGSNLALILSPTGTGFISSQIPDGTTAGGNLRGNNAVDFTYSRGAAADVASGAGAVAFQKSRCTGTDAFSLGNGTASGTNSFAAGQATPSASGILAFTFGYSSTASGNYSFALGLFATAAGVGAWAAGERANAPLHGQFSESAGPFASTGDAQRSRLMARRSTTDATPSNLFLDGSSARVLVPANSSGVAMITVVARTNTAGDQHMTWRRRVNWERGVAVGTVSVDVETMGTDRGYTGGAWGAGPAWTLAITADTTNGAINIIGTGAAATNIRWVADIEWVETTFA